jgi:hypothetical protein
LRRDNARLPPQFLAEFHVPDTQVTTSARTSGQLTSRGQHRTDKVPLGRPPAGETSPLLNIVPNDLMLFSGYDQMAGVFGKNRTHSHICPRQAVNGIPGRVGQQVCVTKPRHRQFLAIRREHEMPDPLVINALNKTHIEIDGFS